MNAPKTKKRTMKKEDIMNNTEQPPEVREHMKQWASIYAACAWQGYINGGRGLIASLEEDQELTVMFFPLEVLDKELGKENPLTAFAIALVQEYDPTREVVLMRCLPASVLFLCAFTTSPPPEEAYLHHVGRPDFPTAQTVNLGGKS